MPSRAASKPRAVRIVAKRDMRGYITLTVTLPKEYVKRLGIKPGDTLFSEVVALGNGKKAIAYYKP